MTKEQQFHELQQRITRLEKSNRRLKRRGAIDMSSGGKPLFGVFDASGNPRIRMWDKNGEYYDRVTLP